MEENESTVVVPDVIVNVDNVHLASDQYEVIYGELVQQNENLVTLNSSVVHASTLLVLMCIFQLYGLLRRASKKGGV